MWSMEKQELIETQSGPVFYFHSWCIFSRLSVTTCRASERVTETLCENSPQLAVPQMLVALAMHIGPTRWQNVHQLTLLMAVYSYPLKMAFMEIKWVLLMTYYCAMGTMQDQTICDRTRYRVLLHIASCLVIWRVTGRKTEYYKENFQSRKIAFSFKIIWCCLLVWKLGEEGRRFKTLFSSSSSWHIMR